MLSCDIEKRNTLTHFGLEDTPIGRDGIKILASVIGKLKALRELSLQDNTIEDSGFSDILSTIENLKFFKTLYFGNNNLSPHTEEFSSTYLTSIDIVL